MITLEVGARIVLPGAHRLPEGLEPELRALFEHGNPTFFREKARQGWSREEPTVSTWAEEVDEAGSHDRSLTFPRGGLRRLRAKLEERGLDWDEVDRLCDGDASVPLYTGDYLSPKRFPDPGKVPWPQQERVVEAVLERQCCLALATMGCGKTLAGLFAAARANLPTIILVWERNLMQQWVETIRDEFGVDPDDVGIVQGKKRRVRSFTLAMQQTLNQMDPGERYRLLSRFGFLIADEAQKAAATTFTKTIDDAPCRYRVALSGGINRKDGKKFLITDLFGQPAVEVTRREMVDAGVVHDVSAVLAPTDFAADWYAEALEEKDETPDFVRLVGEMVRDEERNALCVRLVLERAAELGRRSLVFTHRVEHARLLRQMLVARGVPCGLMLGGDDMRAEFAATKAGLKSARLLAGVGTYQALGVGQDIPAVEVAFPTTPVHGNKDYFGQVTARVCRTAAGKDAAEVVVPWDRRVFGDRPLRSIARQYKSTAVLAGGAMIPPARYMRDYPRRVDDVAKAERSAEAEVFGRPAGAAGRRR